jgi:hypothetical protein
MRGLKLARGLELRLNEAVHSKVPSLASGASVPNVTRPRHAERDRFHLTPDCDQRTARRNP